EMEARREYWQLAQNRQGRIGKLLRENFVYRLLIQRKDTQIAEHRRTAHRLTVRYNNDTERWRRRHAGCVRQAQNWKGQYRNSQNQVRARDQNILNLQQQILALQNNPPNIQRIGMAGYIPPSFSGNYDEDIDYFINEFRRYFTASGNNLANNADRISALGFFKSCLKGKAGEWLEREIAGKNWELSNIISTVNRTLAQLQGDGQARIVRHLSPTAPAGLNAQLVAADAGVGALVISGHTVFNEYWAP